jgi:hypothetical protein
LQQLALVAKLLGPGMEYTVLGASRQSACSIRAQLRSILWLRWWSALRQRLVISSRNPLSVRKFVGTAWWLK